MYSAHHEMTKKQEYNAKVFLCALMFLLLNSCAFQYVKVTQQNEAVELQEIEQANDLPNSLNAIRQHFNQHAFD